MISQKDLLTSIIVLYEDGIWKPPYSTEWPDCASKF